MYTCIYITYTICINLSLCVYIYVMYKVCMTKGTYVNSKDVPKCKSWNSIGAAQIAPELQATPLKKPLASLRKPKPRGFGWAPHRRFRIQGLGFRASELSSGPLMTQIWHGLEFTKPQCLTSPKGSSREPTSPEHPPRCTNTNSRQPLRHRNTKYLVSEAQMYDSTWPAAPKPWTLNSANFGGLRSRNPEAEWPSSPSII